MTVNTTNITSGPYAGNDVADQFSYTFRVTDRSQLKVYETDDNGVQTLLTVDTDYTVAGIGDDDGGTITRVAGALPTGYEWFIRSNYKETQLTAFESQGAYFPDLHENMADKLTFLIQQLRDTANRSVRLADSIDVDGSLTLPLDATARAGLSLGFDSNGDLALQQSFDPGSVDQPALDKRHTVMFANVAAMKAVTPVDISGNLVSLTTGLTVHTQGYTTAGDGGGATYLVAASQAVDGYGDHTLSNGNVALLQRAGNVDVKHYGAAGDGVTDDTAAIQAAIDAAVTSGLPNDGRCVVSLGSGNEYKVTSNINLKTCTIDATGSRFLLSGTAGFLVGIDCGFISSGTKILCEEGYTGKVFSADTGVGTVVHLEMTGRCFIQKLGVTETSSGYGVDVTGFHRSIINVEVRNMFSAVYAFPTTSSEQTYYNEISVRASTVGRAIYLRTGSFDIVNGNIFDYISIGSCDYGVFLLAGATAGPGSNTFNVAYIENVNNAGLSISGDCRYNLFTGGVIETVNDVKAIDISGAKYNTFCVTPAPASVANALEATSGCEHNNFYLGRYGTWIDWSDNIGPSELYKTDADGGIFIGGAVNERRFRAHDTDASSQIDISDGVAYVYLTGVGNVDEIVSSTLNLYGVNEVTIVGNAVSTIVDGAAVTYPLQLKGNVDATPAAGQMITFVRSTGYSNSWYEKSRSF